MAGTSFPASRGGDAAVSGVGAERDGSPVLENSVVVVSAVGADVAVQLPVGSAGSAPITVVVVGDASAQVFPPENGSIQGGAIDAAYEVPLLVPATFIPVTDNDWAVNLSAATSAPLATRTPESEAEAAKARVVAKEKSKQAKEEAAKAKAEAEAKAKAKAERAEKREHGNGEREREHRAEA